MVFIRLEPKSQVVGGVQKTAKITSFHPTEAAGSCSTPQADPDSHDGESCVKDCPGCLGPFLHELQTPSSTEVQPEGQKWAVSEHGRL